jgi:2,4-dienoyl-CoA reductase-like NADH-dependent reductase (Old Yellow Enzyme family)/thioredoxin reductase
MMPPKNKGGNEVGTVLLKNRMVMAPMETMHNHADGSVSQDMVDYYVERARGGIGLIVVQNSAVDTIASRSAYRQLCINSDHLIPGLAKLAEACKLEGAAMVIQLGHGGRQTRPVCVPGVPIVAPSPVPLDVPGQALGVVPKEITLEEIEEVQDAFANAARRAKMAGLDGVEIHGAHGYLIGGFISPKTNRRMDKYGGPLANRARFALEIIAKVRATVGQDFMVGFRMSADEFTPGGLTLDEAAPYAKLIADAGVDYIHVSAGTYESRPHLFPIMYYGRGHLLHLADGIKRAVKNVPIIAVGALDVEMSERVLQEGKADLIAFGRGLLADPGLPNKLANNRVEDIIPCILGNEGCTNRIGQGRPLRCEVNPAVGREATFRMTPAAKKKVMVIGGGIAGMEAARTAALRGHEVTLVEKSDRLGGHMVAASVPRFKSTVKELLSWAEKQINKSNIKVQLNTEATPNLVKETKPDVLIGAIGSTCKTPSVPGGDKPSVVMGTEVLLGQKTPGTEVVVVGGGTVGSEAALYIAEELKKKVTIVEMLDDILIGHELLNKTVLKERLQAARVTIHTGWILREIRDRGVVCEDKNWQTQKIPADTVVLCTGLEPRKDTVEKFRGLAPEVYAIGDCVEARRIYNAFEDAWYAVLKT